MIFVQHRQHSVGETARTLQICPLVIRRAAPMIDGSGVGSLPRTLLDHTAPFPSAVLLAGGSLLKTNKTNVQLG